MQVINKSNSNSLIFSDSLFVQKSVLINQQYELTDFNDIEESRIEPSLNLESNITDQSLVINLQGSLNDPIIELQIFIKDKIYQQIVLEIYKKEFEQIFQKYNVNIQLMRLFNGDRPKYIVPMIQSDQTHQFQLELEEFISQIQIAAINFEKDARSFFGFVKSPFIQDSLKLEGLKIFKQTPFQMRQDDKFDPNSYKLWIVANSKNLYTAKLICRTITESYKGVRLFFKNLHYNFKDQNRISSSVFSDTIADLRQAYFIAKVKSEIEVYKFVKKINILDQENERKSCVIDIDNTYVSNTANKNIYINNDLQKYIKYQFESLLHMVITIPSDVEQTDKLLIWRFFQQKNQKNDNIIIVENNQNLHFLADLIDFMPYLVKLKQISKNDLKICGNLKGVFKNLKITVDPKNLLAYPIINNGFSDHPTTNNKNEVIKKISPLQNKVEELIQNEQVRVVQVSSDCLEFSLRNSFRLGNIITLMMFVAEQKKESRSRYQEHLQQMKQNLQKYSLDHSSNINHSWSNFLDQDRKMKNYQQLSPTKIQNNNPIQLEIDDSNLDISQFSEQIQQSLSFSQNASLAIEPENYLIAEKVSKTVSTSISEKSEKEESPICKSTALCLNSHTDLKDTINEPDNSITTFAIRLQSFYKEQFEIKLNKGQTDTFYLVGDINIFQCTAISQNHQFFKQFSKAKEHLLKLEKNKLFIVLGIVAMIQDTAGDMFKFKEPNCVLPTYWIQFQKIK